MSYAPSSVVVASCTPVGWPLWSQFAKRAESQNDTYCTSADDDSFAPEPLPPGPRRIIAARACLELRPGDIANLGIGRPEGIAQIAAERGLLNQVTLTVESGPIGDVQAVGIEGREVVGVFDHRRTGGVAYDTP